MLQWHPADAGEAFFHNDCRDGAHVGVVRATDGREVRVYDRPIYAVTPDGRRAFSVNFARLQTHRPGYGYAGSVDPWVGRSGTGRGRDPCVDLETGASRLVVSLADARRHQPQGEHACRASTT